MAESRTQRRRRRFNEMKSLCLVLCRGGPKYSRSDLLLYSALPKTTRADTELYADTGAANKELANMLKPSVTNEAINSDGVLRQTGTPRLCCSAYFRSAVPEILETAQKNHEMEFKKKIDELQAAFRETLDTKIKEIAILRDLNEKHSTKSWKDAVHGPAGDEKCLRGAPSSLSPPSWSPPPPELHGMKRYRFRRSHCTYIDKLRAVCDDPFIRCVECNQSCDPSLDAWQCHRCNGFLCPCWVGPCKADHCRRHDEAKT